MNRSGSKGRQSKFDKASASDSRNGVDPTFDASSRSTWEILRRVAVYLRPYRLMAFGTVACAVLSLLSSFAFPRLTQFIIDEVIRGGQTRLLAPAIAALGVAFLLRDLFNSLRIRLNNTFEQNVIFDMRRDVYSHLQRLPVNYFDQRASGDLMTRVIEDVNAVERVLIDGTEQGTVAVLSVVGVLVVLFYTNASLAVMALIPLPLLAGGALAYTLTAHHRYQRQRRAASAMNALLMDNLRGIRQIKLFGRESHEDDRFAQRADDLRQGTLCIMRVWALYSPAMAFFASLGSGLVLWYGGRQVLAGRMSMGELVGFLLYLSLFYDPIGRLHGLNQMLQAARAAGERVFDILDAAVERPQPRSPHACHHPVRGEVTYDQVSFGYGAGRQVLHGISLRARPGEMVALVGPTGAGKSSVVNLLPAFYEPTDGRIAIDGQDISRLSLTELRGLISVVSQEPFLFNGTVRENILYGKLTATEDEFLSVARAANCHDFICHLPDGYHSRVGERGVKLSVGEKQRISIARALLKNAPILILDEATASVDTATEKLIQEALERLMENRTSFVIAHRLSTIQRADQILVMRQGRFIEQGTHQELVARNGLYARLARIQLTLPVEAHFTELS
ncbi:MAG: ABC transporter ATP-binding protein/permease [Candidatus Omnitrophica bacterium]|nr:ABC transporter ATP-binding protein/permease [Candidatus Omnitrophota bacterium]